MEDYSEDTKVSMLRYILLNVTLPLLFFLSFILAGYIIHGLTDNYKDKKAEVIRLSKVLASTATANDHSLIASQVNLIMLQDYVIEDIQFYPIENAIELNDSSQNEWRNALFNHSESFHEEVLVNIHDMNSRHMASHESTNSHTHLNNLDYDVSSNTDSSKETALIGYINITLDLQAMRQTWFEHNFIVILISLALFLLLLLLIYMRLFLPFKALSNMASDAKYLSTQNELSLESFIYSDKGFDEIDAIKGLVATLDKRHKELLENYEYLTKKELSAQDNRLGSNKGNNNLQSMIIHELKSLLNDISDGLKLIGRSYLSEEQAKAVAIIRSGNKELDFTLNQIIQLDRIEKGQIGVSYSELHPVQMLNSMVQTYGERASKKGLVIKEKVHHVDHILAGDVKKIQTILNELLLNAIKYTEVGGINIESSMMYFVDSIRWTVMVSDTGVGIEPKYLDDIFLPFFQINASDNQDYEGTGIGLGIAKKLTELLGGSLTVESVVGEGTTFTLALHLRSWHQSELFTLLNGIKIIALESETPSVYIERLEGYGTEIEVFTDRFAVVEYLQLKPSDVLLISDDVSINKVMQICQLIRSQETSHRVLIVWYQTKIDDHKLAELEAIGLDYVLDPSSSQNAQVTQIRHWVMG